MAATAPLRQRHPAARWTAPAQLHLTMAFLGAIAPDEVARLDRAIADVTAGWRPFAVTMGEGGGFTDREDGGVAWLGVADGREEVIRLSLALDAAMGTGAFSRRPPRPHLTLARKVNAAMLDDLAAEARLFDLGWPLDNVALFRSHTDPTGSRYEEISRHWLGRTAGTAERLR